eukprot:133653-Chlamydomonas_euryale.AAC.1
MAVREFTLLMAGPFRAKELSTTRVNREGWGERGISAPHTSTPSHTQPLARPHATPTSAPVFDVDLAVL